MNELIEIIKSLKIPEEYRLYLQAFFSVWFILSILSFFYLIERRRVILFILFLFIFPILYSLPVIAFIKVLSIGVFRIKLRLPERKMPVIQVPEAFQLSMTNGTTINVANPFRGVFVTGGAGAGKSQSIIVPLIYQSIEKNYTGLLYDYENPVLARHVWTAFNDASSNVKCYFINFKDLSKSHRLNPLDPRFMTNSSYAREYSTTIMSNLNPESIEKKDFWIRSAEIMFASVQWFLREEHPQYCTLPHAVSLMLTDNIPQLIEVISTNDECAGMVASIKAGLKSENQTAGVMATVQNAISGINTPEIFWVFSGSDLTLDLNNPDMPKFLTIGNEPTLVDTYSPVISLVVSAALKLMNQQDRQHSIVMVDELPTIYIPNLERLPATARKNKIATVLCVQDFSQLEDKYGEKKTEIITSVLANQFFGKTTNPKTAERISKIYGKHDMEFVTRSHSQSEGHSTGGPISFGSDSRGKSYTESTMIQERDRVKAQELGNLNTGEFYGTLVDNDIQEFKGMFIEELHETAEVGSFTTVSESEIKANFKKIKEEALSILDGRSGKGSNEEVYVTLED
ncbi:MAG: type IV secretion system DNA-binding domain-containing protein [Cyclobacteriaceae bacterium]